MHLISRYPSMDFFAHSVLIELASPQTAQLSLHFCWKVDNQLWCASTRDHEPLIDWNRKEKRRKMSSGNRTWDLSIHSPMRFHLSHHHSPVSMDVYECSLIFMKLIPGDQGQLSALNEEIEDLSLLVFSEESLKQLQKRIEELKTERAQQKNKFK